MSLQKEEALKKILKLLSQQDTPSKFVLEDSCFMKNINLLIQHSQKPSEDIDIYIEKVKLDKEINLTKIDKYKHNIKLISKQLNLENTDLAIANAKLDELKNYLFALQLINNNSRERTRQRARSPVRRPRVNSDDEGSEND